LNGGSDGVLDYFAYIALSDSGTTLATRDVILDFEDNIDQIHIFHVDANTTQAGLQHFDFLGTDELFGNVAGQLRARTVASGWIIEGDVNGDKKADFSISVLDSGHTINWDSGDFFGLAP
jgi:hypothetical protein